MKYLKTGTSVYIKHVRLCKADEITSRHGRVFKWIKYQEGKYVCSKHNPNENYDQSAGNSPNITFLFIYAYVTSL